MHFTRVDGPSTVLSVMFSMCDIPKLFEYSSRGDYDIVAGYILRVRLNICIHVCLLVLELLYTNWSRSRYRSFSFWSHSHLEIRLRNLVSLVSSRTFVVAVRSLSHWSR